MTLDLESIKMETVFESDFCVVKVYPESKIVHHEIKKYIFDDNFRNMMTSSADAFEKYNCTKYISDDRQNGALKEEDRKWGEAEWEPRLFKCGWKAWALVMPEKIIGQMNMRKIVERYESMGVTVSAFSDFEEAMTWLKQQ